MSEKVSRTMSGAGALAPSKPVPMKLFATWEVDRTPSNCIPRYVSLMHWFGTSNKGLFKAVFPHTVTAGCSETSGF